MNNLVRLVAESSSRPRTPSPLCEGGGGVRLRTLMFVRLFRFADGKWVLILLNSYRPLVFLKVYRSPCW